MLFKQVTHDDLGCASYLISDERAGVAAVVDPRFEIDEYLELARYRGSRSSLRLAWIATVGDRPVADGGDSNCLVVVRKLVDDPVRADSQRV